MTRVLHLFESYAPVPSGYAMRSAALYEAQRDHPDLAPAAVVSSRQSAHGARTVEGHGIVLASPSARERATRRLRPYYVDESHHERLVHDAARAHGADLLHVHYASALGIVGARVARRLGIPLAVECRFDLAAAVLSESVGADLPTLHRLLRRWFERHQRHARLITVASDVLRASMVEARVPAGATVVTVANVVDTARYHPGSATALRDRAGLRDRIVVGTTAHMLRYERLDALVAAVARAHTAVPALHLVLVGDGPQRAALERLAADLRCPVTFTGPVGRDVVPELYRAFDLFVVPRADLPITRYASPLKLREAMASGVACIATCVGDMPALLAEGRGALVDRTTPEALADVIVALARDDAARARLGAAARAWAEGQPSWSDLAATYAAAYRAIGAGGVTGGT